MTRRLRCSIPNPDAAAKASGCADPLSRRLPPAPSAPQVFLARDRPWLVRVGSLQARRAVAIGLAWLVLVGALLAGGARSEAAPGLCVGPVCGDEFTRSAQYHWQLRLRVSDQRGHHERLVVDCRSGAISPQQGLVERGYAAAVARRACRLAGESNA